MKKNIIILLSLITCLPAGAQIIAPGGVDGPKLWYAGELSPGGQVLWKDQLSGELQLPDPGDPAPAEKALLNFNPAFHLAATGKGLELPFATARPEKRTLFTVFQAADTLTEKCIWSFKTGGSTREVLTTHRVADLKRFEYLNFPEPQNRFPRINTYLQHLGKEDLQADALKFQIGNPPADFQLPITSFTGTLPELIIYDRVLSPEERRRVESYLAIKYGTSLAPEREMEYLNAQGQPIYTPDPSGEFIHRLAGIGRDDRSGLFQKQSGSSYTPGLLVISAGAQAENNTANQSNIPDGHFLLWTDNNEPLDWNEKAPLQLQELHRRWQINATGQWADLPTEVRIDTRQLRSQAGPGETYWLAVDRNGRGHFEYFPLNQIYPGGKAAFPNINWDTDGSGKDLFTIALGPELIPQVRIDPPQCRPARNGSISVSASGGRAPYHFQLLKETQPFRNWETSDASFHQLSDLPPGDYELIIRDAGGKEYRETFFFQSADAPVIALAQRYELSPEKTLLLDGGGSASSGLRYQWQTPEGQTIRAPQLEITAPGTYRLEVEDQGCVAQKSILVEAAPSGNFRQVELFPNPSTGGNFRLRVHLEKPADLQLVIYDPAGRLIKQQSFHGSDYYQTGDQLSVKGAYMIRLISREDDISLPLIVQ